ncbi:putative GNAT family acetyltransferase [Cladophialophora carrionii]|uniref:Putative GNAT family acetyltransferase n=1 Tax=Cladophialophora carrionii TaxID=86049 RepID=A0A1C1CJI3_9EURO|nr:putative GNAT family acetyltransferase [Cladophialophora carrionii]
MPLVLQEAVEADTPRIVEVERLAYASNPLSPILFPGPFPPEAAAQRAEGMIKQLREDPTVRWVKAVDTDTGELAAFAKWEIIEKPKVPVPGRSFGPGCNIEACEEYFGGIHRKRHPKSQGRGAGSMLIKWGLDIAEALGLPAYLESSPVAHRLYQKFGFRDIDELVLRPQWNYGSANPSVYFMLREAQGQRQSND